MWFIFENVLFIERASERLGQWGWTSGPVYLSGASEQWASILIHLGRNRWIVLTGVLWTRFEASRKYLITTEPSSLSLTSAMLSIASHWWPQRGWCWLSDPIGAKGRKVLPKGFILNDCPKLTKISHPFIYSSSHLASVSRLAHHPFHHPRPWRVLEFCLVHRHVLNIQKILIFAPFIVSYFISVFTRGVEVKTDQSHTRDIDSWFKVRVLARR